MSKSEMKWKICFWWRETPTTEAIKLHQKWLQSTSKKEIVNVPKKKSEIGKMLASNPFNSSYLAHIFPPSTSPQSTCEWKVLL